MSRKLSLPGRGPTVWTFSAMALGVGQSCLVPGTAAFINRFQMGTGKVPIATRRMLIKVAVTGRLVSPSLA